MKLELGNGSRLVTKDEKLRDYAVDSVADIVKGSKKQNAVLFSPF